MPQSPLDAHTRNRRLRLCYDRQREGPGKVRAVKPEMLRPAAASAGTKPRARLLICACDQLRRVPEVGR